MLLPLPSLYLYRLNPEFVLLNYNGFIMQRLILVFSLMLFTFTCSTSPYHDLQLTSEQRAGLLSILKEMESQYDPVEKMLVSDFSSPGYHTTLKDGVVHRTRQSLQYAASCLDSGDPELVKRGFDIIERVIQLQDQNPQSNTYGIWSWFLEEPLEQMSPPDWNWADFCGVQLLQAVIYHHDTFPPALLDKVNEALYHAARSIEKRNVGPGYTNIAIMGTYVTLMTAELQQLDDLKEYAQNRLRRFYDYTMEQGGFTEYNSPTYTIVALEELSRMRLHVVDLRSRKKIEELYDFAWKEIATHFHPPTRQWGGPHSRSYSTLLSNKTLALLQAATSDRVQFTEIGEYNDLEAHRLLPICPSQFEFYFVDLSEPRSVERTFKAVTPPLFGTTYLHPIFCLGTINHGDFWNQRRPVLLYWGDAENPCYLRVRFTHDGYDFAAAQLFSVQEEGVVLFGVVPATDGGDTHVNLDRLQEGRFTAQDLRLRFEIGGMEIESPQVPRSIDDPLLLNLPGLDVGITIPYIEFTGFKPYWQSERYENVTVYDVVIYEGEPKQFDLSKMDRAAVAGLIKAGDNHDLNSARIDRTNDRIAISCEGLRLEFPVVPDTRERLLAGVNGFE